MSNSDEIRWLQRLDSFEQALANLTTACEQERLNELERAGLIKNFEICFELSWKVLKDFLFFQGYNEVSPRAVIRKSFEMELIGERNCETLLEALDRRNLLSHTYRKRTAIEAESLIRNVYHPALMEALKSLQALRKT